MYVVLEVLVTLATKTSVSLAFLPGEGGEYGRRGLRPLMATGPRCGDGYVYEGVASREDSVDYETSGLWGLWLMLGRVLLDDEHSVFREPTSWGRNFRLGQMSSRRFALGIVSWVFSCQLLTLLRVVLHWIHLYTEDQDDFVRVLVLRCGVVLRGSRVSRFYGCLLLAWLGQKCRGDCVWN